MPKSQTQKYQKELFLPENQCPGPIRMSDKVCLVCFFPAFHRIFCTAALTFFDVDCVTDRRVALDGVTDRRVALDGVTDRRVTCHPRTTPPSHSTGVYHSSNSRDRLLGSSTYSYVEYGRDYAFPKPFNYRDRVRDCIPSFTDGSLSE